MEAVRRPVAEPLDSPELLRRMAATLLGLAAFDFLAPGMLYETNATVVLAAVQGVGVGQLPLLAIWAVLGPARFWRRWLAALAALGLLYAALLGGLTVARAGSANVQMFSVNLLMLPLVFLAAQFPLWLLRVGLGRGLAPERGLASAADGGVQFRVRDLLTVFVLVGAGLGLSRLGVSLHDMNGAEADGVAPWLYLALACTLFGVWSALLALPCVWAAFLARDRVLASAAVVGYVLIVGFFAATIVTTVSGTGFSSEFLVALLAFHGAALAVIMTGCQMLRGWGFTLRREGANHKPG